MNMERQKQQWEEEEEEEEAVTQLQRRRDNKSNVQPSVNCEANVVTEHAEDEEPVEKKEIDYRSHAAEKNGDEVHSLHNDSVYFDKNQGIWKCRDCNWTYHVQNVRGNELADGVSRVQYAGLESSVLETNSKHEELPIKEMEFDIQRVVSPETKHHEKDSAVEILPCSSEAMDLCEEKSLSLEDHGNETSGEKNAGLIEDNGQEFIEFDVERVIERQTTHDLYCPNCNSCITRRVILIRKKPRVRNVRHKSKPDESENTAVDANTANAASDNHYGTYNVCSNDGITPAAADENLDRLPDIFRCLSCSSLFTSIGNCIKPFRVSRNNSDNVEIQDVQNQPLFCTNWFFSLFALDNRKATTDAGDRAQGHSEADGTKAPEKDASIQSSVGGLESPNSMKSLKAPEFNEKINVLTGNETAVDHNGNDLIQIAERPPVQPPSITGPENADIFGHSLTSTHIVINVAQNAGVEANEVRQWDILKSIVYGGLLESITSLGIVSSAAASGAATLDILVMGLANLIGGLFIIFHNLKELKNEHAGETSTDMNTREDLYQQQPGRRENFSLHATVVVLSFLIFGLIPPVIYGFSFRKSDNRDLKIVAVAGSSLACIILLAVGKAHTHEPPRSYFKTILSYVIIGITTSGLSYVAGELLRKLFEKFNLFETSTNLNVPFLETSWMKTGWSSY